MAKNILIAVKPLLMAIETAQKEAGNYAAFMSGNADPDGAAEKALAEIRAEVGATEVEQHVELTLHGLFDPFNPRERYDSVVFVDAVHRANSTIPLFLRNVSKYPITEAVRIMELGLRNGKGLLKPGGAVYLVEGTSAELENNLRSSGIHAQMAAETSRDFYEIALHEAGLKVESYKTVPAGDSGGCDYLLIKAVPAKTE